MFDLGVMIAGAGAGVGAIVWFVRLEGRINGHDTLFTEREKLSESQHEELKDRLVRIEAKLDKLNDSYRA